MLSIHDRIPVVFTRNHMGEWRLVLIHEFGDEPGKRQCYRFRFDVIEE